MSFTSKSTSRRLACAWLPVWPIQRLRCERPELEKRPVVLFRNGRRGPQVAFCSAAAAARGVCPGQPLAEARSLLETGGRRGAGRPVVEEHDPRADLAALRSLAGWCQRFTPHVGIDASRGGDADDPPETLLFDITGCAPPRGGEAALVERMARDLSDRRLDVRLAVADTLGAAWAVARSLAPNRATTAAVARIPPGEHAAALTDLPVAALRLKADAARTMHELGVERIGQLRALPRSSLPSRFGKDVLTQLDRALGAVPETFAPVRPDEPIVAEWNFEPPAGGPAAREFAVKRVIEQAANGLAARREAAARLMLRLVDPDGGAVEAPIGLARPSASPGHLFDVARARLERLRLPPELSQVRLEVTATAPVETRQQELFDDESRDENDETRSLAVLIDRLVGRLGESRVLRPRLVADAAPEKAFALDPMVRSGSDNVEGGGDSHRRRARDRPAAAWAASPDAVSPEAAPSEVGGRLFRPLHLFPRPEPVTVIAAVPEGPPHRLLRQGREETVLRAWGPERIETGWWRNDDVRRDYYRVETADGARLWLFLDRRTNDWFLQGAFE